MADNQWGDERPWEHITPDSGGGSYSPGSTIEYNPKTGRYEPTTRQPSIGTGPGASPGGPGAGPSGATPPAATTTTPPVTPTPWWKTAGGVGNILNGALALYGISREGQTPNTYPVPLTKTEQDTAD